MTIEWNLFSGSLHRQRDTLRQPFASRSHDFRPQGLHFGLLLHERGLKGYSRPPMGSRSSVERLALLGSGLLERFSGLLRKLLNLAIASFASNQEHLLAGLGGPDLGQFIGMRAQHIGVQAGPPSLP